PGGRLWRWRGSRPASPVATPPPRSCWSTGATRSATRRCANGSTGRCRSRPASLTRTTRWPGPDLYLESVAAPGSVDPDALPDMSLRPLIDIAAENERVHALAARVRSAAEGGEGVAQRASSMLRPLLLATLLEDERGLAERPALL